MLPCKRRICEYFCTFQWMLILDVILFCHGLRLHYEQSKPGCFELTINAEDGGYNWHDVPPQMKIPLSCNDAGSGEVISLESVMHCIALNESNICPHNDWANHSHIPQSCCYSKDIMKCEEVITLSDGQRNECNGKTECELLVNRQDLSTMCRRKINYNCLDNTTKPVIHKCRSRWVAVGYNCIRETEYGSEESLSCNESSSLIIGFAVTVCVFLLLIILITVMFYLKYRHLKTKYDSMVSIFKANHETDVPNDMSLRNELNPGYERLLREQADKDGGQYQEVISAPSNDRSGGQSTPMPQKSEEKKTRKSSYGNVADDRDKAYYINVEREPKKKNRAKDIDASNTGHDPDKEKTPRVHVEYINVVG